MKKLLLTGCNGQLGRALNELWANRTDLELVNTDVAELDITDVDAVVKMANEVKPYAIVNCAAYTAVDACETQEELAFKINAIGPRNLSIAATNVGAKMVQISTDYVFPGTSPKPLVETDAVGPVSAYGRTKLAGEEFTKAFAKDWFILRTAWLYGDGKNFVKTMLKVAEDHDEVRVVNDQFGSPTSALELAKAIDSLILTDNYGLFHATCEGQTNWADFTEMFYELAGVKTKVNKITTAEYGAAAARPAYSVLDNKMFRVTGGYKFAEWQDAIMVYMKERV